MAPKRSGAERFAFVTVGTTKFDELTRAVDSVEFANTLSDKGFQRLVVQKGQGSYVPCNLVKAGENKATTSRGLEVEFFEYATSLQELMRTAGLVISHAGSGSVFEALAAGVPLIAVPNPRLMHNHQAELADQLAGMQHLVSATTDGIVDAVRGLDAAKLKPYPKSSVDSVVGEIEKLMDFAPKP